MTCWELFGLVVGAAAVFALFLWLSSWLTRRVLDQRERERTRRPCFQRFFKTLSPPQHQAYGASTKQLQVAIYHSPRSDFENFLNTRAGGHAKKLLTWGRVRYTLLAVCGVRATHMQWIYAVLPQTDTVQWCRGGKYGRSRQESKKSDNGGVAEFRFWRVRGVLLCGTSNHGNSGHPCAMPQCSFVFLYDWVFHSAARMDYGYRLLVRYDTGRHCTKRSDCWNTATPQRAIVGRVANRGRCRREVSRQDGYHTYLSIGTRKPSLYMETALMQVREEGLTVRRGGNSARCDDPGAR